MEIPLILSGIGLVCDMVGVICRFFSIGKGLREIRRPSSSTQLRRSQRTGSNPIEEVVKEMADSVNKVITETNDANRKIHRNSAIWLGLIVLGFVFQFVAVCIQHGGK